MTVPSCIVRAAASWPTNADLILDVKELGYLDGHVLDPTYGRGLWWAKWLPEKFTASDAVISSEARWVPGLAVADFTNLPYADNTFDAVAFDPPYVAKGGRSTSGIGEMDDRFGLKDAPKTPYDLQELINWGMVECARVLKVGGYLLTKCKPYISSGSYWDGPGLTCRWADLIGLEHVDQFIHVGNPGPQPPGRRQVHARNNYSVLLVHQKREN